MTATNFAFAGTTGGHANYTFEVPDATAFQNTLNQNGPWPLGPLQFLDVGSRYGMIETTHIEETPTGGFKGHTDVFNGHTMTPLHILVDVVIGHIPGVNLDFGCKAGT